MATSSARSARRMGWTLVLVRGVHGHVRRLAWTQGGCSVGCTGTSRQHQAARSIRALGSRAERAVNVKSKVSELRLFKRQEEFVSVQYIDDLPRGMRGIYVLYKYRPRIRRYDVVYVGMAAEGGIGPRLRSHRKRKKDLWTHCSVFEVWDNITHAEVKELEGIFRHIYRRDSRAAKLNVQRTFAKMKRLPPILPPGRASLKT